MVPHWLDAMNDPLLDRRISTPSSLPTYSAMTGSRSGCSPSSGAIRPASANPPSDFDREFGRRAITEPEVVLWRSSSLTVNSGDTGLKVVPGS